MPRFGYTQNEEEKYIIEALSGINNGRFLDIGAHDGLTFSSTRALLENGWSGVYVEPDPIVLPKLYENIENFKTKTKVYPVAVSDHVGKARFFSTNDGDMVGTLSTTHRDLWSRNVNFSEIEVDVITVKQIEQAEGTNFDFINIDVEGINWPVFKQFDFNIWKPKCVCIEYENKIKEISALLSKSGYKIVYISSENIVAVKNKNY